jgi:hypothetical protein
MKVILKYWAGGTGNLLTQTAGTSIERVYVNHELTGEAVGYFERRETYKNRGYRSYYDRHRQAKGDGIVSEATAVSWNGPQGFDERILDAIFQAPTVWLNLSYEEPFNWRGARDSDPWIFWRAILEHARGFAYLGTGERKKAMRAANAARNKALYELAD